MSREYKCGVCKATYDESVAHGAPVDCVAHLKGRLDNLEKTIEAMKVQLDRTEFMSVF